MEKAKVMKILKIVGNVLMWTFVAFAVIVTVVVLSSVANKDGSGMASIGGYSPVTVLSDSMNPTFKQGDLIIVRRVTAEEQKNLKVGDVISYLVDLDHDGQKEINSHRIIEVTGTAESPSYRTQGDNPKTNPVADDYSTSYDNVLAIWTGNRIGGLGAFIGWLRTSTGFLVCIVLPLVLLFGWELFKFIRTVMQVKGYRRQPAGSGLDEEEIKRRAIAEYLAQQQAAQAAETPAEPKAAENEPETVSEAAENESDTQAEAVESTETSETNETEKPE